MNMKMVVIIIIIMTFVTDMIGINTTIIDTDKSTIIIIL